MVEKRDEIFSCIFIFSFIDKWIKRLEGLKNEIIKTRS